MHPMMPWITVALMAGATSVADTPTRHAPPAPHRGAPVVTAYDMESVDDVNAGIATAQQEGESWPGDPVLIALSVVESGGDAVDERRYLNITYDALGAAPADTAMVTVVTDGYPDDSMRGEWCRFRMVRAQNDTWRVQEFAHAWRCQRGPQTDRYGNEDCP
jgi:hypothetical protein